MRLPELERPGRSSLRGQPKQEAGTAHTELHQYWSSRVFMLKEHSGATGCVVCMRGCSAHPARLCCSIV